MKGLGQVGSSGSQQDPRLLKSRLTSVLNAVGLKAPFSVKNVISYSTPAAPVYDVELDSFESVSSLLKEFYKFTRRRDPVPRPSELDHVSLYRSVTTGTRVRVSLLRVSFLISCLSMLYFTYLYISVDIDVKRPKIIRV